MYMNVNKIGIAKVSIIIPTFNRVALLPRCVQSILTQTHQNIECIVIDDGSTDSTTKLFLEGGEFAGDTRVRYERLQENQGVHVARNHGLDTATGDYVVFLDSDDELLPHAVARALEEVKRDGEIDFVSGAFRTDTGLPTGWKRESDGYLSFEEILCEKSHYPHKTGFVMVRTSLAKTSHYTAPNLDFMYFRYIARGARKIFYIIEPLGVYHTDSPKKGTLTAQRRVPNITRSIARAHALERYVHDFESDFLTSCPVNLSFPAYGAAVGLLLDWKQLRAARMAWKVVQTRQTLKNSLLLTLCCVPCAPLLLRSAFFIKKLLIKQLHGS